MEKTLYHQIENTFRSEFSTCVYSGEKNESEHPHFHKNFELLIVTEGNCVCTLGNREYHLSKGDIICIFPFQIHSFTPDSASTVRRVTFCEQLILTLAKAVEGMCPEQPIFRVSDEFLSLFLGRLEALFGDDSGFCTRIQPLDARMQMKGFLYIIGGEFLKNADLIPMPSAETVVIAVAEYISENFQRDISLSDVAKEKGYNYQYLSRRFNKVMGMNFKKILNQYRLEYAFAKLRDTDLPISTICFDSGFQSIRAFNQVCKDNFGKAPKELRSEILK